MIGVLVIILMNKQKQTNGVINSHGGIINQSIRRALSDYLRVTVDCDATIFLYHPVSDDEPKSPSL